MRKQELLKRIEILEEKVRLLEIALQLHEMTKHPVPVVPYEPWAPATPRKPWECPVWVGTQPDNNGTVPVDSIGTTTTSASDGDPLMWLEAGPTPPGPVHIYGMQ